MRITELLLTFSRWGLIAIFVPATMVPSVHSASDKGRSVHHASGTGISSETSGLKQSERTVAGWARKTIPKGRIAGIVVDDSTRLPLEGANVFLSNTSFGAATNTRGEFAIENVPMGNYELVASMMGYSVGKRTVRLSRPGRVDITFRLKPRILLMDEITVEAGELKDWKKNLKRFKRLFIGTSENAKRCKIRNPEILTLKFEDAMLIASTDGWLVVENDALGYELNIRVINFRGDFHGRIEWTAQIQFKEMATADAGENAAWATERERAYSGSLRHFLSALSTDELDKHGFRIFRSEAPNWSTLNEDAMLELRTVDLVDSLGPYKRRLNCGDNIQIDYTGEREENGFMHFRRDLGSNIRWSLPKQVSWLKLARGFADFSLSGVPDDGRDLITAGYWGWQQIADRLPLNYETGQSVEVSKDVEIAEAAPGESVQHPVYLLKLREADSLYTAGDFDGAEMSLRQALLFEKAPLAALKLLGKHAFEREDWPTFNRFFYRAARLAPKDTEVQEFLYTKSPLFASAKIADDYLEQGKLKSAEKFYKKALNLDKAYVPALLGRARIAYTRNKWRSFQKWLLKLRESDPENKAADDLLNRNPKIIARISAGDSLAVSGNGKAARKEYEGALEINPNSLPAIAGLGDVAYHRRDWKRARKWYEQFLDVEAEDPAVNYKIAISYRESGRHKPSLLKAGFFRKSQKHFDRVMQTDSTYEDVLYQRALLERWRSNWTGAIDWAHQQNALKPSLLHAEVGLYKLYRSYLHNRKAAEVRTYLQAQEDVRARLFAGELFRLQRKFNEAEAIARYLLESENTKTRMGALLCMIKVKLEKQDDEAASDYFKRALAELETPLDAALLFEEVKYILRDDELSIYRSLKTVPHQKKFLQLIWANRDPAPARSVNYRALEHFRRLIHAERVYWYDDTRRQLAADVSSGLKFPRVYKLNEEFNDKGLIYIRHGEADATATATGQSDVGMLPPTATLANSTALPSNESWLYYETSTSPKRIFHFLVSEFESGNSWRLAYLPFLQNKQWKMNQLKLLEGRLGWDSKLDRLYAVMSRDPLGVEATPAELPVTAELIDESRKMIDAALATDSHTWKGWQGADLEHRIVHFRGRGGTTSSYLVSGVDLNFLQEARPNSSMAYALGVFTLQWEKVVGNRDKVLLSNPDPEYREHLTSFRYDLTPGLYNYSIFVSHDETQRIASVKSRMTVPSFESDSLLLSDILLAHDVSTGKDDYPMQMEALGILPNPSGSFLLTKPVFIYFEAYGLLRQAGEPARYEIEYSIDLLKAHTGGLRKLLGLEKTSQNSVRIREIRDNRRASVAEFMSFDVSKLQQGEYEFAIRITDLNSKAVASKSVRMELVE